MMHNKLINAALNTPLFFTWLNFEDLYATSVVIKKKNLT